jgi:GT2 family glycosyltransferase
MSTIEMKPTLSVIIPTCNRNDLLGKCLERLQYDLQQLSADDYEIIVTDDGKDSNAKTFIEQYFPFVQWVEGPKKGPASNRNNGAKYAKGEWLIFLDDDCLPAIDILRQYSSLIERNPSIEVWEGKIEPEGKSKSPIEYAPINTEGGHLWSCNFAIEKKKFDSIGGFDENFKYPHMEDVDLRERLKVDGVNIQFAATASVTHPWRKLDDGKKLGRYQEMYVYYYIKHKKPLSFLKLSRSIISVHLSLLRKSIFSKDSFLAIKIFVEHWGVVILNYNKWKSNYVGKSKS